MVTSISCSTVSDTSTESGTISADRERAAPVAEEEQDHEQREQAADDDFLGQVGERVGDELGLGRHHLDLDLGELLARAGRPSRTIAWVTATVLAPASL